MESGVNDNVFNYDSATATYIYLTSDGGASVTDFFDLAELLVMNTFFFFHSQEIVLFDRRSTSPSLTIIHWSSLCEKKNN